MSAVYRAMQMLSSGQGGASVLPAEERRLEDLGVLTTEDYLDKSFVISRMVLPESSKPVFMWDKELENRKQVLPVHTQGTQDCTSHSWARALEDWLLMSDWDWPGEIATEVLYGGSRVQVGNKQMTAPGSCCAWVAAFLLRFGFITRAKSGFDPYSPGVAAELGESGVPYDILTKLTKIDGSNQPAGTLPGMAKCRIGRIRSGYMAWLAAAECNPMPFACKRGFEFTRGRDGICNPVGVWNHSMVVRGRCTTHGGEKCLAVQNSIGDYLGEKNRLVELEGCDQPVLLPPGVFLVRLGVFDDICQNEDVYVLF